MPDTTRGRDEQGQFTEGSEAARKSGHKGGKESSGSFQQGSERTSDAGRKGGSDTPNR